MNKRTKIDHKHHIQILMASYYTGHLDGEEVSRDAVIRRMHAFVEEHNLTDDDISDIETAELIPRDVKGLRNKPYPERLGNFLAVACYEDLSEGGASDAAFTFLHWLFDKDIFFDNGYSNIFTSASASASAGWAVGAEVEADY